MGHHEKGAELPKSDLDMSPLELAEMYWRLKDLAKKALIGLDRIHYTDHQLELARFLTDQGE